VPTPQPVVDKMLELAEVKAGDVVYDLGCGDGRIVVTAAKKFGVKAIGYDIDPQRVKEARENVRKAGVEHLVRIEEADVFTLDLTGASVITLYLLPALNVRLDAAAREAEARLPDRLAQLRHARGQAALHHAGADPAGRAGERILRGGRRPHRLQVGRAVGGREAVELTARAVVNAAG
jgi:SAM-dependent methyltransferase